jgi:transcriptional regulator of arginine metabolism
MPADQERSRRERSILQLIAQRPVGTQAELIGALIEQGFEVTQATISRDIRRLGLVKKPMPDGGFRYLAPVGMAPASPGLGAFVTGFVQVEALLAIRTLPGRAMAVATAIDELSFPSVTGTLAGDDLVLILVDKADRREQVREALERFF